MQVVKIFILYLVLLIVIIFASSYSSVFFSNFVDKYFGLNWAGGWLDMSDILGLMIGFNFYISMIITLFGEKKKYWIFGCLLVPLLFLELVDRDLKFFGISFMFTIIGWMLGFGVLKLYKGLIFKRIME